MSISIRTIATLAVAAFLGLVAVFLAQNFIINSRQNQIVTGTNGPLVNIVVAAQAIERGAPLAPSMLKLVSYPSAAAPAGAFHTLEELTGTAAGQQRLALRSMVTNEPILPDNVSGPGGKLNLSTIVGAGMRAVSLRSNDVAGVGGFVLPGDRVDILLTRTMANGSQSVTLTQIIAENVRVLGVDQSDNDQDDKPVVAKAVTVEVTPEQAESISLGESVGAVSLTLRHVADDAPLVQKVLTVADLSPIPIRKVKSSGGGGGVRVIRGTSASRFSFGVGNGLGQVSNQVPSGVTKP